MASVFKRNGKGKYYIAFDEVSEKGRKRRVVSSGTTDKRSAQQIANRLEAENALRERGVIDVQQEKLSKQASELVEAHLESFERFSCPRAIPSLMSIDRPSAYRKLPNLPAGVAFGI